MKVLYYNYINILDICLPAKNNVYSTVLLLLNNIKIRHSYKINFKYMYVIFHVMVWSTKYYNYRY